MNDREAVILAGLLHDIGKFGQRAGQKLTSIDRKIESDCCPAYKGKYSHSHVLNSGKWIRENLGERFNQVEILSLYHHAPEASTMSKLAKIVALADRLSSGERESRLEEEAAATISATPLACLFTKLEGMKGNPQNLPMFALDPDLTPWFSNSGQTNYHRLWEDFNKDIKWLKFTADIGLLFHQLLSRLEKYTFFMPSSVYRSFPDISLYHHLKSTAALAGCLYDLELAENDLDKLITALKKTSANQEILKNENFLLVAADISGIQDFIYSVTSEKALKGLKGRSLYLELMAQAVAKQILASMQLPETNLLFLGGGHFYLLLPNTLKSKEAVQLWQERVNNILIRAHNGTLALIFHEQPVSYQHFLRADLTKVKNPLPGFADIWQQSATALGREKRRKFASSWTNADTAKNILGPFAVSGEEKSCQVCSEELTIGFEEICPFCQSFADLARRSAGARFLEIKLGDPLDIKSPISSYEEVFQLLGVSFLFQEEASLHRLEQTMILNDTNLNTHHGPCRGFAFLANHVPRRPDGSIDTLEDLAQKASGIKKWGVLRADVDDLGKLFTTGLGPEDRTMSRVSTLSSSLSIFFSAHVNTLARSPEYRDSVYLVYAGGDDLFLLAPWSVLPDFARKLRHDFFQWTRNCLTLSAGLYLAPRDKFPVYRAANEAGDLVDLAKKEDKNQLGIFDRAVTWENLKTLETIKEQLVKLLDEHQLPRALLSLLMASWGQYKISAKAQEEGKLQIYQVWRLLYGLRRLIERLGREKKVNAIAELAKLEQSLIVNYNLRPDIDVAIRWADYLTRREVEKS